jgi:CO/xanthine dehydrogenase FAD-binding subunit
MGLPPFGYYWPTSLEEALDLLERLGETAVILAGGTDLIPQIRSGTVHPEAVVDISRLYELHRLSITCDQLRIGALATHAELAASAVVRDVAPALAAACGSIAAPPIRNSATIGGNLANASPAADTAPPLLALNATLHLSGRRRSRSVSICDFFVGPGKTILGDGELITAISVQLPASRSASVFAKFGKRNAMAIAVASVAAYVAVDPGSGAVTEARVALGSVGPTPFRAYEAEKVLCAGTVGAAEMERAATCAANAAQPISDVRASADYRRSLASVLVQRAMADALHRARAEGSQSCTK